MEVIRELAAVALVFGLLGLSLWMLRSKGRLKWRRPGSFRRNARRLETLDRLSLTPQHALHLVRAADHVLMLVTHAGGCTLLNQWPEPARETGVAAGLASGAKAGQEVWS